MEPYPVARGMVLHMDMYRLTSPLELANLGQGVVHVPLSQLVARRQAALPPALAEREAEVVVFCHHGQRSSQVAAWLRGLGYTQVFNMDGGIDAWARTIDPSVGIY